jgi:CRISPR-associated protein Cas2
MHVLLLYDITNDRIRTKVACLCEDYGLDRIQYSSFYGRINRNHQESLMLEIQALAEKTDMIVQLIPIASHEWEKRIEITCHA